MRLTRWERNLLLGFFGLLVLYDSLVWAWNSRDVPPPTVAPQALPPVDPDKFQKIRQPRPPDDWWVPGKDGHPGHYELPSEKPTIRKEDDA